MIREESRRHARLDVLQMHPRAFKTDTDIPIQSKRIFILPVVVRDKPQSIISFSDLYKSRHSLASSLGVRGQSFDFDEAD